MTIFPLNLKNFLVKIATTVYLLFLCNPVSATELLDPLSGDEKARLMELAGQYMAAGKQQNNTRPKQRPLHTLLIERHQDKAQPSQRTASIYQYDYDRDHTLVKIFDLTTNQLISEETLTHTQLPLTSDEHAEIKRILFSDPEQMQLIRRTFLQTTGKTLSPTDELSIKAFIFMAESLPGQLNPATEKCGEQRCAQVLLYMNDTNIFEISPIVNLSANIVVQNLSYQ